MFSSRERTGRALGAFLRMTDAEAPWDLALRAFTLHMLEGRAPRHFARSDLQPLLSQSLARLQAVPLTFPTTLTPNQGQARLDAYYLLHLRDLPHCPLHLPSFQRFIRRLQEDERALSAWIMVSMARAAGLPVADPFHGEPPPGLGPPMSLYWHVHRILIASDFLHRPPPVAPWESSVAALVAAIPWIVAGNFVDLACELLLCLQVLGAAGAEQHLLLRDLIVAHQAADGTVRDPLMTAYAPQSAAHTTAAALVALWR